MKNKSLAFKLIFFLSGSISIVFILVFGENYFLSKQIIMKNIRSNAENLAWRTVNKIENTLTAVEKISENTAFYIENTNYNKEQMVEYLTMVVKYNTELYGMGIAFEPYQFDPELLYFAPYYCREDEGFKLEYMGDESYRYFFLDWYQIPRELNRPIWSEPYFDDVLMATYSVPFYKQTVKEQKLAGVVTTDISLEKLTTIVNSVKILKTGHAYLISKNGRIISHPAQELIMNETIFTIAETRNDSQLREIGRKMVRGESGFVPMISFDRNIKSWAYYAPIASTGWTLVVIFPEDELVEDVVNQTIAVCVLGVIGLILLVAVISFMANSITSPLSKMSKAAEAIGSGDLDAELPPVVSNDEVGLLTHAFSNMKISLKEYISQLKETTAAKERIESELSIAREIQVSILPRTFPAFPNRKEFDIYATMEPAKEVGGDFYDFCIVDEKKLYFVIGDVSGKGVPAALFMMIAKTLLKNEALRGSSASEILSNVNNIIALDNSTSMFATVFCGILDIETGELEFSNAGHNPPLFYTRANGFKFLKIIKGFVLGPMPDFTFKSEKIKLNKGDCFFLYTDGVTEAMDPAKELFSEERFLSVSSNLQDQDIRFIVSGVREEIKHFIETEPQSDDITMLILRIN